VHYHFLFLEILCFSCGYSQLHCSGATGGTTLQPQTTTTTQGGATGGPTVQPQTTTSTQGGQGETTMTRARFDCIFDQISPAQRDDRWQGKFILKFIINPIIYFNSYFRLSASIIHGNIQPTKSR
jgi:hypothetical protein